MGLKLYHWTCREHGLPGILDTGTVIPRDHPFLGVRLSWWTHVPTAGRAELALSQDLLPCDRMEVQFAAEVDSHLVMDWSSFKKALALQKPGAFTAIRQLESPPGSRPGYWWVAPQPIAARMVVEV